MKIFRFAILVLGVLILLEQYCEDNETFQDVEKQETNKPAK